MIRVTGRYLNGSVSQFIPQKGYLHIRLDSGVDPTYWVEIDIPEIELLAMIAKVHRLTHAPDTVEELHQVDQVAQLLGLVPMKPPTPPLGTSPANL